MKTLVTTSFLILVVMSVIAWAIQPSSDRQGRILISWSTDLNPDRADQEALYSKLYPKYTMTVLPDSFDGTDVGKNIVQSLAGCGPDIIDAFSESDLSSYQKAGVAWDVTDALRERGVDLKSDLWNATKQQCFIDGRAYGFPANASASAIFYNKDDFDEAGIPYPSGRWTWDQFLKVAQKLTKHDSHGNVIRYGALISINDWAKFVYMWGGRVFVPGGSECIVDTPQSIAALQFIYNLIFKYHVVPSTSEAGSMATAGGVAGSNQGLFGTNQVAMADGGRYWYIYFRKYYPNLRIGNVELPEGKYRVTASYARITVINKYSPHREDALNFLAFLDGPQYNAMINAEPDGIAAVPKYDYVPSFLHDPNHPSENNNAVWRVAERIGVPFESTPYVNQDVVTNIEQKDIDLLADNQETVAEALYHIQTNLNAAIAKAISDDPKLRSRWISDAPYRQGPFPPYIQTPQPGLPNEPGL